MIMIQYGEQQKHARVGQTVREVLEEMNLQIPEVVVCLGRTIVSLDYQFREGDQAQVIKVVCGG